MQPTSPAASRRVPVRHGACALLALMTWGGAVAASGSVAAPPGTPERVAQVADALAAQQGFSGTVLVAKGDTVLLSRGYGMASHEWGVPNGPDVKYLLASVSKQFTAAAVLRLVDQGRLGLDDPVHRHLPGVPAAWQAVTVRQLLAHTAGIPTHTEGEAFEQIKRQPHTPRELWARFSTLPLDFAPGSDFRYSNSGYVMLGLLVEQLSGQSWGGYISSELLAPLGMTDSGVASGERITPRLATGYARDRRGRGPLRPAGFVHLSVPYAAGALYGTTVDLLKWQRALYGGRVLSPAALRAMTTPLRRDYALGLNVTRVDGRLAYAHSGGIDGFSTYLLYQPASQISVAVLGNIEHAQHDGFAHKLGAAADGQVLRLPAEIRPVELAESALAPLQGTYRLAPEHTLHVQLSGQALWARLNRGSWARLWPESTTDFVAPEVDAEFRFDRTADGRAAAVTLRHGAAAMTGPRTDAPAPTLGAQALFLRGSMNGWSVRDRLSAGVDGRHHVELDLAAGAHELKVATEDWQTVDLGQADQDAPLPASDPLALVETGGNVALRLQRPSRCRFELDGRDVVKPLLRVACRPR